jgi:polyhydroxybutyrate depolymerase
VSFRSSLSFTALIAVFFFSVLLPCTAQAKHVKPWIEAAMLKDSVRVLGKEHSFWLYTPKILVKNASSMTARPLVLAYHGYHMKALEFAKITRVNAIAEREGFLVAYPQGEDLQWNGKGIANDDPKDILMTEAILNRIESLRNVDPRRIYAMGFSNGGFFVHRLSCEMPERFAGFASVAATVGTPLSRDCHPQEPVNFLSMNGREDPVVTWEGKLRYLNRSFPGVAFFSVVDSFRFWQEHNQCKPFENNQLTFPKKRFSAHSYHLDLSCPENGQLTQWVVQGGGHTWPGGHERNALIRRPFVGRTTHDINASQVIWDFFKPLQRPEMLLKPASR